MAIQDKIILVFKGILLYTTMIAAMLFIAGVDSLYDKGYFFQSVIAVVALIYACYKTISEEEFNILILNKYFGITEEDDDEW